MKISLSGRAAIVTGGSKGIGFAVATRFAASGANVAIVARTGEPPYHQRAQHRSQGAAS
jgi:3-oxoacyl-[acyl-carrier protein] reductase